MMVVRLHTEFQPGALIGSRFELLERIGSGGMGVVFRARDHTLGVTTALKVLDVGGRRSDSSAEEHVRRFRSEILLARQVRHPNVCAIYEYGEDDGLAYFTMELVEGQDLRRIIAKRGSLSSQEAYQLALEVAAGLEAIHAVGIVHRDLKPANIMRGLDGRVRLMDFGLAKAWEGSDPGLTKTGSVVGSPAYMSPEQIRGQRLDSRSDLYSLGIVIFELFTGRVPFEYDSARAAMVKHLEEEPALDDALLPRPLEPVLRRALAKDPAERQQSVSELVQEISDGWRAGIVATAGPGPAAAPPQPDPAPAPPPPEAALLLPNLIRASRHGDASLRLRAVTAIGSLESIHTDRESALRRALDDPEPSVRLRASAALSRQIVTKEPGERPGGMAEPEPAAVAQPGRLESPGPPTPATARPPGRAAKPGPSRDPGSGDAPTVIRRGSPTLDLQGPEVQPGPAPQQRADGDPAARPPSDPEPEPSRRWALWRVLGLAGVGLAAASLLLWLVPSEVSPVLEGRRPERPLQGSELAIPGSQFAEVDASDETESSTDPVSGVVGAAEASSTPPGRAPSAKVVTSVSEANGAGAPGLEALGVGSPGRGASLLSETPVRESALPPADSVEDSPARVQPPGDAAEASESRRTPLLDSRADEAAAAAPTPSTAPAPLVVGTLVEDPDSLPRLLDPEPPVYPPVALQLRVEQTVMLRILVDEKGRVLEVEELSGRRARPEFLDSATDWVRRQTYAPATKLGVAVRFWMVQPVVYQLNP